MLKIETLSRDHDRSGFDCGNDALNQYLRKIARQRPLNSLGLDFLAYHPFQRFEDPRRNPRQTVIIQLVRRIFH